MKLTVESLHVGKGADALAVLERVCGVFGGEVAMLHSAAGTGSCVIGFDPVVTVEVDVLGVGRVTGLGKEVEGKGPLEILQKVVGAVELAGESHPLAGWLGFVSYDVGRFLERVGDSRVQDELKWPVARFVLYRNYLVREGGEDGEWTAFGVGGDARRGAEMVKGAEACKAPVGTGRVVRKAAEAEVRAKVERVKQYIAAGDIYQANLAQRCEVETADDAVEIYRRLCEESPAPYAGFLRFTGSDGVKREVMSASPELFLAVHEQGEMVTRPIKGTRRRDLRDEQHDAALREELLASEKDKAELAMIVDLLRNDLGRVSEYGSMRVHEARAIEKHPTVWHTVATIVSKLREGTGIAEILRAACPGGSITGAPKIRAMQIIEELEGFRRGLYCGNIGVIGAGGKTMTLNIAIRTILMQAGKAYVCAGGGIVADSDAEKEREEMEVKAGAMLRALGV